MEVTLSGMVTEVRPLQPEKARSPMEVTLLGIITEVRPLQDWKAYWPMVVTLSVMVIFVIEEVLPLNSEGTVTQSNVTSCILLQPEKISRPTDVGLHK